LLVLHCEIHLGLVIRHLENCLGLCILISILCYRLIWLHLLHLVHLGIGIEIPLTKPLVSHVDRLRFCSRSLVVVNLNI
jgi:hypothetical protein